MNKIKPMTPAKDCKRCFAITKSNNVFGICFPILRNPLEKKKLYLIKFCGCSVNLSCMAGYTKYRVQ